MLTREQILAHSELRREKVEVPEWGGVVLVTEMSAKDRDDLDASSIGVDRKDFLKNMRARLAVRCIVGEDGKRLFTDEDAALLGEAGSLAVTRIIDVANRLNKMTDADLEDLKGNS